MNSNKKEYEHYPYVIVLILTYNGKHLLEESISSYLNNSYRNFNVVVIDNGSSDGSKEYIEKHFPKASVIRLETNKGYSGGFNFGLSYAVNELDADYVLVTNDDVYADKELINELIKITVIDEKIGFITGKVYYYNQNGVRTVIQTVGKKLDSLNIVGGHIGGGEVDEGQYDQIVERDFIDDVFTLVKNDVIVKTGGYDENFFLQYEELDWQLRAKKFGYKIFYTPYAKLWHKIGMSTGGPESPLRYYYNKRNRILLVKRHGTVITFFKFIFLRIFYYLPYQTIMFIIKNRLDLLKATYLGTLSGLKWLIRNPKN